MAGTRDRLIHGYFDVDLDIIWNIISRDLPLDREYTEVYLNVAVKRGVGMLPTLYNCGLFICFMGNIRCHP
ncbi:MAG: DUF86 domain-containing protein, partial [Deltaproteobacteria bacterium]|nr:DUF86 domain-containing protein [Deltaproteobacteria bacterium]